MMHIRWLTHPLIKTFMNNINVTLTASTTVVFNSLYFFEDLSVRSYENFLSRSFTETVSRAFSESGNVSTKPARNVVNSSECSKPSSIVVYKLYVKDMGSYFIKQLVFCMYAPSYFVRLACIWELFACGLADELRWFIISDIFFKIDPGWQGVAMGWRTWGFNISKDYTWSWTHTLSCYSISSLIANMNMSFAELSQWLAQFFNYWH